MKEKFDKFTTHFKKTLTDAQKIAKDLNKQEILPEHLLVSLSWQKGSIGSEILKKSGIKPEIKKKAQKKGAITNTIGLSKKSQRIIAHAAVIANKYQHPYIGTEHLLASIIKSEIPILKKTLQDFDNNEKALERNIKMFLGSTSKFPDIARFFKQSGNDFLEPNGNSAQENEKATNFFAKDLTSQDIQVDIDPVIAREKEIERLVHILSRRTKNNPVLVGDAGVGKTAIVEGLAKRILEGNVPANLLDKKILSLDLSLLVAGSMYRGEFEGRFKQILEEIENDPNIILFIDEIHTIVGTGSSQGSMDAANIIKPALAKGKIRCIGATTIDEYRKHIESDPALDRRFQQIIVEETSEEDTMEILKGIKHNYEKFHNVLIDNQAIRTAVTLSNRYITDRQLPDKAIDLIDEAASKMKIQKQSRSIFGKIKSIEKEIHNIQKEKRRAVWNENYDEAISYKKYQEELEKKLEKLQEQYKKTQQKKRGVITEKEIYDIIAQTTKIPVSELQSSEKKKLLKIESKLKKYIIGQDEAITKIAQVIRKSRAGLHDSERPLGSFIFLGPSGVGKTETAKRVAEIIFEDTKALIRLDMSEFSEGFHTSKLLGAPAGYVGYKDGAKLTDQVRRRPYSVILFDEIEKAHPDIFNLLLQILEDGHITDASGKTINFKNTVIIMTSNIGIESLNESAALGFKTEKEHEAIEVNKKFEKTKQEIQDSLKEYFKPEFLNRIDNTITFNPLKKDHLEKITKKQLQELIGRIEKQGHLASYDNSVIKRIAEMSTNPETGARMIRKNIEEHLEHPIVEKILSHETEKKPITITVDDKKKIIVK